MTNGTTDGSSVDVNTATVEHVDQSRWAASGWGDHALKMIGFFIPVHSGSYKFCVKARSTATVYMSSSEDPNAKVRICPSYSPHKA